MLLPLPPPPPPPFSVIIAEVSKITTMRTRTTDKKRTPWHIQNICYLHVCMNAIQCAKPYDLLSIHFFSPVWFCTFLFSVPLNFHLHAYRIYVLVHILSKQQHITQFLSYCYVLLCFSAWMTNSSKQLTSYAAVFKIVPQFCNGPYVQYRMYTMLYYKPFSWADSINKTHSIGKTLLHRMFVCISIHKTAILWSKLNTRKNIVMNRRTKIK